MKTARPEIDETTGKFKGAIGAQGELTPDEKKLIRRTLATTEEPLHLSQLAVRCDIPLDSAPKQSAIAQYVQYFLVSAGECEMSFRPGRRNTQVFQGWKGTRALVSRVERGLA
jgi:hypothetical protein